MSKKGEKMRKFLKKYGLAMFLGAGIDLICGYNFMTWQWWAIIVPAIILASWKSDPE